jgi:hypothetical protein
VADREGKAADVAFSLLSGTYIKVLPICVIQFTVAARAFNGGHMKSIWTMRARAAVVLVGLLAGCCTPMANPPEGARIDLVINELKRQLANIGRYDIHVSEAQGAACGPTLKAVPAQATITLKTAANTTVSGSGSGNIPISFVVITPSVSGSYSRIHTQTVSFDSKIDPGTLPPFQTVLPSAAPTTTPLKDENYPDLKAVILGVLESAFNADHNLKPCFLPTTLKIQTDFQVTKKVDGGIQINFIVAKIGTDVSVTNDYTQSLTITMNLDGSLLLLR